MNICTSWTASAEAIGRPSHHGCTGRRWCLMVLLYPLAAGLVHAQTPLDRSTENVRADNALLQTVVTVNGQAIPHAHAEILVREQTSQGAIDGAPLRLGIRETLINQALMVQAARAVGLDRAPLAAAQIELASQAALVKLWQQREVALHPPSDEALQAEYRRQVDRLGQVEYRLRHLLVANEASARQLIGRIQSGTPMADLVEAYSLDAGTRSTDGLAGWVPRGHLHEALVQAVDRLKPGMTSPQPVRTVAGWHVLQLEDARPLVQPPFEAIRPLIVRVLAQKTVDRQIQVLRSTAKIE